MKKILPCIFIALLLSSCSPSMIGTGLKDGVYTGSGDPWLFGSEDATVTVKGGRITGIVLRKFDTKGKEINYDMWNGMSTDGTIRPDLKGAREKLAVMIIQKQAIVTDTVSGCTISGGNWKTAVRRALDKAR